MVIRTYQAQDLEALKRIHAKRGLPPACLPDVSNPLFFVQRVIEEDGKPVAALFVKLTAEPFLLLDPDLPTAEAFHKLSILSDVAETAVRKEKIEDITMWIPNEAGEGFGKVVEGLGFVKSPWQSYSRILTY